jgi:Icc-related predicted phosphoesterase
MTKAFHVSDLHGKRERYEKLFSAILSYRPEVVFISGDLYPSYKEIKLSKSDFFDECLIKGFEKLKFELNESYPTVFIILGNDDPKQEEHRFLADSCKHLWKYINMRTEIFKDFRVSGYSYIPPTPFIYKDWEVYDVSRYVDPGCIHPTSGKRNVEAGRDMEFATIKNDLDLLVGNSELSKSIFVFHCPPYSTNLDRAALDNMFYYHVPLDVHIGSIAIKEFIIDRSPLVTLHGHVHESSSITGIWKEKINKTICFNAATEQYSLVIVIFDIENPENGQRIII